MEAFQRVEKERGGGVEKERLRAVGQGTAAGQSDGQAKPSQAETPGTD